MSPASGVTFLDHTADVGFDVRAPTPAELFHAAALALLALLRGNEDADAPAAAAPPATHGAPRTRTLRLAAPDPARLLADWLRELLFLHEIDRLDYEEAEFEILELAPPCSVHAVVALREGGRAVREIKGVTYHEIDVHPVDAGWSGRVIFDV